MLYRQTGLVSGGLGGVWVVWGGLPRGSGVMLRSRGVWAVCLGGLGG